MSKSNRSVCISTSKDFIKWSIPKLILHTDEIDMVRKFKTATTLQPIITALFCNSPFYEGKPSGFLSMRTEVWRNTDKARSGIPECLFEEDFGYEKWLQKAIEYYHDPGDCVVLISSSGKSKNIINAAKYAKKKGLYLITFSGFNSKNKLRSLGKLNFWINSNDYNVVENIHQIWLLSTVDSLLVKN